MNRPILTGAFLCLCLLCVGAAAGASGTTVGGDTSATAQASGNFTVSNITPANATVTEGEVINISADIKNVGSQRATQTIELTFNELLTPVESLTPDEQGGQTSELTTHEFNATQSVTLNASENATVTFQDVDTGQLGDSAYSYTIASANDSARGFLDVLGKTCSWTCPPRDPDDDGLYEDVRGDGEVRIFDVQTLFSNLDSPAVQDNAAKFNFQGGNPDKVTIFDVQALFEELA